VHLGRGRLILCSIALLVACEKPIEKGADTLRIAVLGDTIADADEVDHEHRWTSLLEKRLENCPKLTMRKIEVLRFREADEGMIWKYDPDLVLLALHPSIPATKEWWRATEATLVHFRDEVAVHGKEAWLTTMTSAIEVQASLDDPHRRIEQLAEQHGVRYIEQLEPLAAVAKLGKLSLYGVKADGGAYLSSLGHVAVAEVIGTRLCEEGFKKLAPVRTALRQMRGE
jgi:hypothetical protein